MSGRRAVAAVLTAALLAGCGLPSQGVERIDPRTVPFDLLATASPTASPQPLGPMATIYLVARNRLRPVPRQLPGVDPPAEAVKAVLDGPSAQEAAQGIGTDVPARARLVSLKTAGSVATVELSAEFGTVSGTEQVLAVAEIVYTLTEFPQVRAVAFVLQGQQVEVPDASGSLSAAPRTRADYAALAPP